MLDIHYNITQGIQNEVSSLAISVSIKIKLLFIQQDQLPSGTTHSSAPVYCHILCVPLLSNQLESEHTDLKDLTCPSRILSTGLFLRGNFYFVSQDSMIHIVPYQDIHTTVNEISACEELEEKKVQQQSAPPCSWLDFTLTHLNIHSSHKGDLQTSAETFGRLLLQEELSKCAFI